jgi:hypothetical protein
LEQAVISLTTLGALSGAETAADTAAAGRG